jgi:hypothetical protein
VTPVHAQRFVAPPESIADLARNRRSWHLVRGEILPLLPPGTRALELPFDLPSQSAEPPVLARIDVEETAPYARPRLLTVERARDFYFADGSASPALVRLADDDGLLHPDVELHLSTPFVEHALRSEPTAVTALVRAIGVGAPVYVLGRIDLEPHGALGGLREAPLIPRFGPGGGPYGDANSNLGPLHVYDEPAFRQLAAWYALPWYRKLSLLVRNR